VYALDECHLQGDDIATAKVVRMQIVRHSRSHLVNNQMFQLFADSTL
jgi:hypothetical protein